MKVLVTGAGGLLGSEVVRSAEAAGHEVLALTRLDLDVADPVAVAERIRAEAPGGVLNCAARTDVDAAEDDLGGAMEVNAEGAAAVARAAAEVRAKVVYPSTDYVFDGDKPGPYVESDAPRPQSVYGQSKLAGEQATEEANARHFVVRTALLFGTGGANFVDTMLTLGADHGEVLVARDQISSPTYAVHLAEALVRLLSGDAYGVHHMAGDGECSRYELAEETFRRAGVECRVLSCTLNELALRAPRPTYSALVTDHADAILLPTWQEGLGQYLEERAARR